MLDNLNARLLRAEAIDIGEHAQAVSTMMRIAARLGVRHRQRDVMPTLAEYLRTNQEAVE
jgi:hypothetical protein